MASKATMERLQHEIDVASDSDILTAATRMAGEDLCSISDLSSFRGTRPAQARP